jgi:hypothetical protein
VLSRARCDRCSSSKAVRAAAAALVVTWAPTALSQPQEPPPPPAAAAEPQAADPPAVAPATADVEQRLKKLETDNARMREQLEELEANQEGTNERVDKLLPLSSKISGYVDFGFFWARGNGTGIRPDTGHRYFPEYDGVVPDSWVFMGDPLSTAINARGDPAETGESRAVTFDPVDAADKTSFIVNNLNLALFAAVDEVLLVNAAVDLVPRGRDVSNPDGLFLGDFIDLKLAYVEYRPQLESLKLSLFAGKFDSVLGYEYRVQEAPDRIAVTPSLLCRYTCGRPLGLKARVELFGEVLNTNVAVTNGSHFVEGFPFYDEIDSNQFKTLSGRMGTKLPVGSGIELGVSGAFGAQDLQGDDDTYQWHAGVDLHADIAGFDLSAEYGRGRAVGRTTAGEPKCNEAPCIDYKAAYGQLGYRITNWLMPYGRVDWRNALHESGGSFVYISELVRTTGGARFEIGTNVVIKGEYTHIFEIDPIPQFPNDVLTTSLAVKY